MPRRLMPQYLAALDFSKLDDNGVHELIANIEQVAPESPLVAGNPLIQASLAALLQRDDEHTGWIAKVADDRQQLRTDLAHEAQSRTLLHGELRSYVSLLVGAAQSPADLAVAGVPPASPRPPRNQPPEVPQHIDVKPPSRGRGKTVVSVHETGERRQYVAEQSIDGIHYTPLGVSRGKTRTVTGPSGTQVWVRFAMVRGPLQSDWSTPVIVTIP
jgi:hypothetical protein